MPPFPTPLDAMMLSIRSSIAMAEAGRVLWHGMAAASIWWLPAPLPPAPARTAPADPKKTRR